MMKVYLIIAVSALLVAIAGCTLGLSPEQAAQVKKYEQTMADKRAKLKMLQDRVEAVTKMLEQEESGSGKWKALLKERDEVIALIKETTVELKEIAKATKDLKAQGVPAWSIALNGLEQLALLLFGGGGLLSGAIGAIKNAKLRKVANTMIGAIENDVAAGAAKTVKKAIKDKATENGSEVLLNSLVKKAGG